MGDAIGEGEVHKKGKARWQVWLESKHVTKNNIKRTGLKKGASSARHDPTSVEEKSN